MPLETQKTVMRTFLAEEDEDGLDFALPYGHHRTTYAI